MKKQKIDLFDYGFGHKAVMAEALETPDESSKSNFFDENSTGGADGRGQFQDEREDEANRVENWTRRQTVSWLNENRIQFNESVLGGEIKGSHLTNMFDDARLGVQLLGFDQNVKFRAAYSNLVEGDKKLYVKDPSIDFTDLRLPHYLRIEETLERVMKYLQQKDAVEQRFFFLCLLLNFFVNVVQSFSPCRTTRIGKDDNSISCQPFISCSLFENYTKYSTIGLDCRSNF